MPIGEMRYVASVPLESTKTGRKLICISSFRYDPKRAVPICELCMRTQISM